MKHIFISSILAITAISASAETYRNETSGTDLNWSNDSMWLLNSNSAAGQTPQAADSVSLWYNSRTPTNPIAIYVDETAVIKSLATNFTAGATLLQLNANGSTTGTSMTIDGATPSSTATLISNSAGEGNTVPHAYIGFEGVSGSSLYLTNSLLSTGNVLVGFANSGSVTQKTIRFGENVSVLADRNVSFSNSSAVIAGGYNIDLAGAFMVKDGATYKNVAISGSTGGVNLNVKSTGVLTANDITFSGASDLLNIDGIVNIMKSADYTMSKGSMTINGNLNLGTNGFVFSGGNLTIGSNTAITAASTTFNGTAANSTLTFAEGITFAPTTLKYTGNQKVYVNGTVNTTISGGDMRNVYVGKNGVFNLNNRAGGGWTIFGGDFVIDGKLTTTGFTLDSKIASGHMTLNEGAIFIHNNGILRLDGNQSVWSEIGKKAILTINSTGAFRKTESDSQDTFTIEITGGECRIEMNADNAFGKFEFSSITDPLKATVLTLSLEDDILLELGELKGLTSTNLASLIIENFDNDKIKISNTSNIDFSKITSTDLLGGETKWSNFRMENGYLVADMIPEPATWAAIFGALALGFAVVRRRK